jgi:hypothetical protein
VLFLLFLGTVEIRHGVRYHSGSALAMPVADRPVLRRPAMPAAQVVGMAQRGLEVGGTEVRRSPTRLLPVPGFPVTRVMRHTRSPSFWSAMRSSGSSGRACRHLARFLVAAGLPVGRACACGYGDGRARRRRPAVLGCTTRAGRRDLACPGAPGRRWTGCIPAGMDALRPALMSWWDSSAGSRPTGAGGQANGRMSRPNTSYG